MRRAGRWVGGGARLLTTVPIMYRLAIYSWSTHAFPDAKAEVEIQALGRTIHEVLILAVLRAGPKHGYQIALDVERETAGVYEFQHGTLYPILHRLEREGRIRGRWKADGGRRRKVYELTAAGRAQLGGQAREIEVAFGALMRLVGGDA